MTARHWVNNDTGYDRWLSEHPDGFVANVYNPPRARYFKIHRATHNLPDRSKADTVNPRTGNQYSKVTAPKIPELIAWATRELPAIREIGPANYCKVCTPTDESPIDLAPTADFWEYVQRADLILAHGHIRRPTGVLKPSKVQGTTVVYFRDPHVRAWVLKRADGRCELCNNPAPFLTEDEEPYLESHHLILLAEGGPDTPDNTAALCPNCHRNLHYGTDRGELRRRLTQVVVRKETALGHRLAR